MFLLRSSQFTTFFIQYIFIFLFRALYKLRFFSPIVFLLHLQRLAIYCSFIQHKHMCVWMRAEGRNAKCKLLLCCLLFFTHINNENEKVNYNPQHFLLFPLSSYFSRNDIIIRFIHYSWKISHFSPTINFKMKIIITMLHICTFLLLRLYEAFEARMFGFENTR